MSNILSVVEPWAESWTTNLWRASWQGAILIVIAWGVARWCSFL
jgi:hypothetical protein